MAGDSAPDKSGVFSPDPAVPEESPCIDCAGRSHGNIDSDGPVLRDITHYYYSEDPDPDEIQTDPHTLVEQVDAHIASVREYTPGIREDKAKTACAQVALLLYDKSYNGSKNEHLAQSIRCFAPRGVQAALRRYIRVHARVLESSRYAPLCRAGFGYQLHKG